MNDEPVYKSIARLRGDLYDDTSATADLNRLVDEIERLRAEVAALLAVPDDWIAVLRFSNAKEIDVLLEVKARMTAVVEGEPSVRDEPPWEHIDTKGL